MLGNFYYANPTKLYFGEDALQNLEAELQKYGDTVQLIYGGGSIKKADSMTRSLKSSLHAEKPLWKTAASCPIPQLKKYTTAVKKQKKMT